MNDTRYNRSPDPHLRFANELERQNLPWLWPNRIPLGHLTLLVGDPGLGKSLLAADLAARVSAAQLWPDAPPLPLGSQTRRGEDGPKQGPSSSVTRPRNEQPTPDQSPSPSSTRYSELETLNSHLPTFSRAHVVLPFGVLLAAPEDPAEHVLIPRLTAAGADLSRIAFLDAVIPFDERRYVGDPRTLPPSSPLRSFVPSSLPLTLPDHVDQLEQAIRAFDVPRLVILDPLHALLSPAARADPPQVLTCLADIAHRKNVAILAIVHLAKARSTRTLYRVRGSLNFIAAARAAYLLSADPDDPDRRILSTLKFVYGPPPPPLAFRIAAPAGSAVPRIEWDITPSASAALSPDLLESSPEAYSALDEACTWLADYLAAGPRRVRKLIRDARAAGFSPITLRRAKRALRIRAFKTAPTTPWHWGSNTQSDNISKQPDNNPPQDPQSKGDQIGCAKP